MQDIMKLSILFDYYGGVLTDKQADVCDMYFNQNLSLGEISEIMGITRQGVRDSLKKSEKILLFHEEKLGIYKKDLNVASLINKIDTLLDESDINPDYMKKIKKITDEIKNLI
ncbi:MAG: DNA-binding protein [Clostridia bacterium]|nr:DNA-binding protein [Clostridia bacterium]